MQRLNCSLLLALFNALQFCLPVYAATRNGCNGALDTDYVSTASCYGQTVELESPYAGVDTNICQPSTTRVGLKNSLNFTWATVPPTTNDLARAVTTAPTMISVKADGRAWQYYVAGIASCSTDSKSSNTNRECMCVASRATS
jgi:hypothetical protein